MDQINKVVVTWLPRIILLDLRSGGLVDPSKINNVTSFSKRKKAFEN
jgi:hypothetical protein